MSENLIDIIAPTEVGTTESPYNQIITNVVSRHTYEIKDKVKTSTNHIIKAWRRKIINFMGEKNEELLSFLQNPLKSHPTLSNIDKFLNRFGSTSFSPTHDTMRHVVFDISGQQYIEDEFKNLNIQSFQELNEKIQNAYEMYQQLGESLIKKEHLLRNEIETFDKIYKSLIGFLNISDDDNNESTGILAEQIEKYLTELFKQNKLEDKYIEFIKAYRKFIIYRKNFEILRSTELINKEPICAICVCDTVSRVLTSCGHTFCEQCSNRQMIDCCICRTRIKERIKIYFG